MVDPVEVMADLKERLRAQADGMMFPNALEPMTMREAADRIEALEAELAARDGEIVAWLRGEDRAGDWPAEWGVNRMEQIATAIERGEYKDRAQ